MNTRGFTLFEILVVLLLISVSSSLIYLNVGRSAREKRSRIFAQEMVGLAKQARRSSVALSRPIAFMISSQERRCWVEGEASRLDIPEIIQIQARGVAQLDADVYGIYFYPDGSSSGGELTLLADGKPFSTLRVDTLTGLVISG